jgi:hypothetical protein
MPSGRGVSPAQGDCGILRDLQDLAAGALIWICQPSSLICLESGSSIWGVVAPAWAKLKRLPRTPSACMRLSSSVDTASLTMATIRAEGPNESSMNLCLIQ